jgi:hypothetical protein
MQAGAGAGAGAGEGEDEDEKKKKMAGNGGAWVLHAHEEGRERSGDRDDRDDRDRHSQIASKDVRTGNEYRTW